MRPTSVAQFEATVNGGTPAPEVVRDGLRVIALPLPPGHVPYTLSYLLTDSNGGVHIIDAGWDTDENWSILRSALAGAGETLDDVVSVTVTHLHPDHLAMAARIRRASGARVAIHAIEQEAFTEITRQRGAGDANESWSALGRDQWSAWGAPPELRTWDDGFSSVSEDLLGFEADVLLEDGQLLDVPGRSLRVLHTPGHTAGHICIRDEDEGVLFTGDHVLPAIYSGLGLGGRFVENPISAYLASLARVAGLDADEVCPGHNYRFAGLAERCADLAAHHQRRSDEVAAVLAADPGASVWQIAGHLSWSAGWENLAGPYLQSAVAQTAMHVDRVRSLVE